MRITILADNTVAARTLRGEHGLAFYIDIGGARLLFDTGQGLVLAENAKVLGVDMGALGAIVLSHGHYDHTGGLAGVLRAAAGSVAVHAHPDALLPKYQQGDTGIRYIGMPAECRAALAGEKSPFVPSRRSKEVAPGVRTTGEIRRMHPEEAIAGPFCRDPEGREIDLLPDDQALFLKTAQGTVVLLGCAHSGVINTLDGVRESTEGRPIGAVIGGMHLRSATEARIQWTIRELRRFNLGLLVPLHCTGPKAAAMLGVAFPDACQPGGAGTVFEF